MASETLEAEIQLLDNLKIAAEKAKSNWHGWIDKNVERSDGSQAQDQRFARHLESVESEYYRVKASYEEQLLKVNTLKSNQG